MAHHSSESSDILRALIGEQQSKAEFIEEMLRRENDAHEQFIKHQTEKFGATGKFPMGKLVPEDEGEIRVGIAHISPKDGALGKVVIDFGKPTAWIGFTPEQAHEIAHTLLQHAAQCYPNPAGAAVGE